MDVELAPAGLRKLIAAFSSLDLTVLTIEGLAGWLGRAQIGPKANNA
jgi:hypothetical protein